MISMCLPAMGAPMKADRPWHMVTRPNSLDKEFKPINSTIRIDLRETNTAEKKEKSNIANASISGFIISTTILMEYVKLW